jgi:RNA polymerase sigma-70 factor (ECF subfamily)
LFTIAYNQICKIFRKRAYQQKYITEVQAKPTEQEVTMEDSIDYGSVLERVQVIVEKLPVKQKVVFMKSRMEGKSSKEIAEEVGLAPGTVDNYISAALKFITSRLQSESLPVVLLFLILFS